MKQSKYAYVRPGHSLRLGVHSEDWKYDRSQTSRFYGQRHVVLVMVGPSGQRSTMFGGAPPAPNVPAW